mmetsp:Transcript_17093/g.44915  ORF Transcript_17093/g.44915 Transcript_17093/m.44915 type:complete len:421 (-) Transcript_17093:1187-2449(-)
MAKSSSSDASGLLTGVISPKWPSDVALNRRSLDATGGGSCVSEARVPRQFAQATSRSRRSAGHANGNAAKCFAVKSLARNNSSDTSPSRWGASLPRYAALVAALARSTPPSVARAASSSSFSCETIASSRVRDFNAVPARANAAAKASDGARKRLKLLSRSGAELSTPRTPQNAPAHCAAFSSFNKGARLTPSFCTAHRVSRSTRRRGSRSRTSDPNLKPSRSSVSRFDLRAASPTAFADVAFNEAVCSVSNVFNKAPTSRAVSALQAMSRALMDANFETRGGRATTCATAKPPTRSKEGRMPWTCSSDAARGLTVPSQLPLTSRSTNDFGSFASNAWSQTSRIWEFSKPTNAHERKASAVPRQDASKGGRSSSVDAVAASSDSSESDAASSLINRKAASRRARSFEMPPRLKSQRSRLK